MTNCMTRLGRYEITGDLGRGAMGMVFKARDPVIDRSLAIKTSVCRGAAPDQGSACERRFFAEARFAGRLNHPNIVTVHDAGRDGEVAYIAMEFVEGRTLREVLDTGVVLGVERIVDIAAQLADGLAYAHAHGLVHCDVKPANVMLLDDGRVKIADFGTALPLSEAVATAGTAIGSPKYMSPEQATGQRLDCRSDIFSIGVVLYEMLTGLPPFDGETLGTVLQQVVSADPAAPSSLRRNLDPVFDAIVAKALAKRPELRYRTATEMAADLRRHRPSTLPRLAEASNEREETPMMPTNPRPTGALSWPRRLSLGAAATAMVATAMVLTGIAAIRVLQPAPDQAAATTVPLAAQAAPARAAEGRARTHGTRKASTRTTVARTKAAETDRQADFAWSPQQPIAPSRTEKAATPRTVGMAKPAKASSPEQLCADSSNFISRGFCENRVCLQSAWQNDPFCVQKREQNLRSNPLLASGG